MRYELRRPADVTPFDDMVHVDPASGQIMVAIPETTIDAIANLVAAGFTIEGVTELFDVPSDTIPNA